MWKEKRCIKSERNCRIIVLAGGSERRELLMEDGRRGRERREKYKSRPGVPTTELFTGQSMLLVTPPRCRHVGLARPIEVTTHAL